MPLAQGLEKQTDVSASATNQPTNQPANQPTEDGRPY